MKLRELCEKYGVKYNVHKTEKCRKKLSKFCEFERNGNDYTIIRELSDEEKVLISDKFTSYIEDILIKHFVTKNAEVLTYTYIDLFEILGLINNNWRIGRNNVFGKLGKKQLIETNKFDYNTIQNDEGFTKNNIVKYNIKSFFRISNKLLKEIVVNSLTSIEKRNLLSWDKTYKLYILPKKKGDYLIERDITDEECSKILSWTKEALDILGYKTEWMPSKKDKKKLTEYVNNKILKEFGYDTYAKAIRLRLAPSSLQRETHNVDCRKHLNKKVVNKLLASKELKGILESIKEQCIDEYIAL